MRTKKTMKRSELKIEDELSIIVYNSDCYTEEQKEKALCKAIDEIKKLRRELDRKSCRR